MNVFQNYKLFGLGGVAVEDEPLSDRPLISSTDENIDNIRKLVNFIGITNCS